jgi:lipopolysaccharide transport system permease protein
MNPNPQTTAVVSMAPPRAEIAGAVEPPAETPDSLIANVREMIVEFGGSRELLWQMTVRDLKLRYKQSLMGFGWAILMPLLIVCAGCLVRAAMAHVAGGSLEVKDVAAMVVKAIPWAFFVGSVSFAVVSLTSNLNLVTKIYFPREVFPFSAVLTQAVDSAVGIVALVALMAVAGIGVTWAALWFIPLTILLFLFTAGVCLLLACGNLFFRDVKYLVQLLLNFGVFFTPVFYEPIDLGNLFGGLMLLNPLSGILEGFRLSVIEGHSLTTTIMEIDHHRSAFVTWSPDYLLYSGAWSVGLFAFAWYVFHKLEFIYAEYI